MAAPGAATPDVDAAPPPGAVAAPSRAAWARAALVVAVLAGSGGVRHWQSSRVRALLEEGRRSPFPLAGLPLVLGDWRGSDTELDPRIAAGTGAVDRVFRHYVNALTGVGLDVIILYGPSTDMFIHSPERCYPAAGYGPPEASDDRTLPCGGGPGAPFRSLVYARAEGGREERQEVYYSWRYLGRWSPDVGTHKQFERVPGMYKVQLARRVSGRERRDIGNPCESFLGALLPEFERRAAPRAPAPS